MKIDSEKKDYSLNMTIKMIQDGLVEYEEIMTILDPETKERIENFCDKPLRIDEKNTYDCQESKIIIYPKEPYNKSNYDIEIELNKRS